MESETTINPLGVWLKANGYNVVKVKSNDFHEEKTGLAKDTTNTILSESASSNEILVIHDYCVTTAENMNIVVSANNEDILSTTERYHKFGEGILVEPLRSIEIKESHTNANSNSTSTEKLSAKVVVHATSYRIEKGQGVVS